MAGQLKEVRHRISLFKVHNNKLPSNENGERRKICAVHQEAIYKWLPYAQKLQEMLSNIVQ
jgi:hypothetical protein